MAMGVDTVRATGFTLIEVLIAMAATVFVAAAAYSGVSAALTGAEQLRASAERTSEMHRALAILDRDLRQFVDRPVRDEYGELQPGISGGPLAYFLLSLTRAGWHNTLDLPRSDLQRVDYYLEDGDLWRAYYPVLDRVTSSERLEVRLLDDVENFEVRFLGDAGGLQSTREGVVDTSDWVRNWIGDRAAADVSPLPPVALELRITLEDRGLLRRMYVLPTP